MNYFLYGLQDNPHPFPTQFFFRGRYSKQVTCPIFLFNTQTHTQRRHTHTLNVHKHPSLAHSVTQLVLAFRD